MFDNVFTNKIVAFILTPIVTALTAWLVPFIERNLPGNPDLNDAEIAALAVAGAIAGFGIMLKFLSELAAWQKLKQFGATDTNVVLEGLGEDEGEDFPARPDIGDAGKP